VAAFLLAIYIFLVNRGPSECHPGEESPLPKERCEENDKTREKMRQIKSQLQNLNLVKEQKEKVSQWANKNFYHILYVINLLPLLLLLIFCGQKVMALYARSVTSSQQSNYTLSFSGPTIACSWYQNLTSII
jgi:hypothetical protein